LLGSTGGRVIVFTTTGYTTGSAAWGALTFVYGVFLAWGDGGPVSSIEALNPSGYEGDA
jgi:hypothetical protein